MLQITYKYLLNLFVAVISCFDYTRKMHKNVMIVKIKFLNRSKLQGKVYV